MLGEFLKELVKLISLGEFIGTTLPSISHGTSADLSVLDNGVVNFGHHHGKFLKRISLGSGNPPLQNVAWINRWGEQCTVAGNLHNTFYLAVMLIIL